MDGEEAMKIFTHLAHVSVAPSRLALIVGEPAEVAKGGQRVSVSLAGEDFRRLLDEIADNVPGLLHDALDRRLIRLINRAANEMRGKDELPDRGGCFPVRHGLVPD